MKKRLKLLLLAVMLALAGVFSLTFKRTAKADGEVVYTDRIKNATDWNDFAAAVNAGSKTNAIVSFEPIDDSESFMGVKQIGNEEHPFVGRFDYNVEYGYPIYISIDYTKSATVGSGYSNHAGIFGYASNATFNNCNFTVLGSDGTNHEMNEVILEGIKYESVGGLIGKAANSTFINCSSQAAFIIQNDAGESSLAPKFQNYGGLIGESINCSFENCNYSTYEIDYEPGDELIYSLKTNFLVDIGSSTNVFNIGGFVGKSVKSTYKSCTVTENNEFISLYSEICHQKAYVGGFVGQLIDDNELYFCDVLASNAFSNVYPTVSIQLNDTFVPENYFYIGGFIGGALYDSSQYTKGSVIASSLVQKILFKNETVFADDNPDTYFGSFIGVVDDNSNNEKEIVTFINCSAGSSVSGSNTANLTRSVLAGLNNSESSIYYAVDTRDYSSATVTGYQHATPIYIATENDLKKYKNIGTNVIVQVLATQNIADVIPISQILSYNSTQTFGPEGSTYKNKPEYNCNNIAFDMDDLAGVPKRKVVQGTLDEKVYSREVEYTYDESNKTNKKYIAGSYAQMDYDRTVELEHKELASGNTWYADSNFETPASLNSMTAGSKYVVYAKTEPEKYTLSLSISKTARNTPSSSVQVNYGGSTLNSSIVVPIVTGYKFDGYYLSSDLENPIINANGELITTNSTYFTDNAWTYSDANKTIELIAQWVEKSYTITFDVAGGNKEKPADQTTPFSTTTIPSYQGEKDGYTRKGWKYTVGSDEYIFVEGEKLSRYDSTKGEWVGMLDRVDVPTETSIRIDLTANWVANHSITITGGRAYNNTIDFLTNEYLITGELSGSTVYVVIDHTECEKVVSWNKTPSNLNIIEGDGCFEFTMPDADVVLSANLGPNHTLTKTNQVDADCTHSGTKAYWICSVCNKYFDNEDDASEHKITDLAAWKAEGGDGYLAPLGHDYVWVIDQEPTYTSEGIKHEECTVCHDKRNENTPIDMLVCSHASLTQIAGLTPTCTQPGYKDYYECDDCHKLLYIVNNSYVEITDLDAWKADAEKGYLAPLGHDYVWVIDQEPTYTSEGIKHEECTVCHDKRNENTPIDMLVCPHTNLTHIAGLTPTCTQPGYKDYYECDDCHKLLYIKNNNYVEIDNLAAWKVEGGDGYLAPLGHDWGDPVYTWHLNVPNCVATSTCTRNDSHVKADVAENEHLQYVIDSQADCTHNEKGHYVATFTVEGFETQNSEQIEKANTALGHTNVIVYEWSQDKLKCSAYYECSVCGERELIEEVNSVYVKISDATCLKNEEGKRTATFTTAGLENQETPKYEIENTGGHIFGEPTYVWNNGSCTATRVCTVDETHIETETVAGVYQVVTAATCTVNETGKYRATFTNPAFAAQESEVSEKANSALGHNYEFTRIEWTSFTAKAFYTCVNDESHVVSYDCTIASEITKAPTCLEKGVRTYTATYENHIDTKTEELAIGSHSLDYVAQVDATHDTEGHTAYYECSVCHKLFSDAEGNHEITRNSTIIPKLVRITVYGATILNSTGTLADVKAGDKVTIQANEPEEGKEFKGWALSEGGAIISTNSSIEITIGSDIQYYAVYADVEKPKTGLPTGALIGIIAGSVALAASALVVVFVVLKKKKKAQE